MQSPTCAFSAPASSVQSSKNQGAFGATIKQGKDWPQIWLPKLAKSLSVKDSTGWHFTCHFFVAAAEAMRRILVDRARQKARPKHGGDLQRVTFETSDAVQSDRANELLAINEAL